MFKKKCSCMTKCINIENEKATYCFLRYSSAGIQCTVIFLRLSVQRNPPRLPSVRVMSCFSGLTSCLDV